MLKVRKIISKVILYGILLGFISGIIYFIYIISQLPDINKLSVYIPNAATVIYSNDNTILAKLYKEENRMIIPLEDISDFMKKGVIAIEDRRFYKHHGIDVIRIFRAMIIDLLQVEAAQGASTLTQQLVRNILLTKQKTIKRKTTEIILALQIERKYKKDKILELYLNQVYWGHNTYGIESASQYYFGKNAKDLNLEESALLISILRAPELYSPIKNLDKALVRKNKVLKRLLKLHCITKDEYKVAISKTINFNQRNKHKYLAPYFVSYIIQQVIKEYGEQSLYVSGMNIYTTLDYNMQKIAERIVSETVGQGNINESGFNQAAMLVLDPNTGYILAMVGGYNSQYNIVVNAMRQPGSAFKPITYLCAFEKGYTPSSIIYDGSVSYGNYHPINYDHEFLGNISLRKALEESRNVPAVKLTALLGPRAIINTARALGIKSPIEPYLTLTLGASELTMLEITSAYNVFASGGIKTEPISIKKITYSDVLLRENKTQKQRVFQENIIKQLVSVMQGVITKGTGKSANIENMVIAGKTGTTSDYKDAWFIGFIPGFLTVATWVGNDDNTPMNKITGGSYPAIMWKTFITEYINSSENLKAKYFIESKKIRKEIIPKPVSGNILINTINIPDSKLTEDIRNNQSLHNQKPVTISENNPFN